MLAPRLQKGDTIALFSPSSPISASVPIRYQRGKKFLEQMGFNILEGNLTGKSDFYRSGTIVQRADELNQLIQNSQVKCIMSTTGGYNSNSILPYIDYECLKSNPKIIIGYSDITALLLGIYAKTGLTTYYGPAAASSFGEFAPLVEQTFEYFCDIAMGEKSTPHILPTPMEWSDEFLDWSNQNRAKATESNKLITLSDGLARGRLIGGNLNTISGIFGTEYMPEIKGGDILLIEDSLKSSAEVERSFSHLRVSGVFDKIGGLILGKHEKFNDMGSGRKTYEILTEVIGHRGYPILAEFDCCHTHPMLTMPIGCEIELDSINQTVTILSQFVG